MNRLRKKKEEEEEKEPKQTQSLSRGAKAAASIASKLGSDVMGAVEDVKKEMAAGMKKDDKKEKEKRGSGMVFRMGQMYNK